MFARTDAFDHLLDVPLPKEPQQMLQRALLQIVDQLRRGDLVPAELVHHLRWCLAKAAGFPAPEHLWGQQDASEFFLTLLDTLHAPVLSLRVVLMHGGEASAGDDQVISERMIELGLSNHTGKRKWACSRCR